MRVWREIISARHQRVNSSSVRVVDKFQFPENETGLLSRSECPGWRKLCPPLPRRQQVNQRQPSHPALILGEKNGSNMNSSCRTLMLHLVSKHTD